MNIPTRGQWRDLLIQVLFDELDVHSSNIGKQGAVLACTQLHAIVTSITILLLQPGEQIQQKHILGAYSPLYVDVLSIAYTPCVKLMIYIYIYIYISMN